MPAAAANKTEGYYAQIKVCNVPLFFIKYFTEIYVKNIANFTKKK